MAEHTQSEGRAARQKELQDLPINELGKLSPYKENVVTGIKGDDGSENPSKVEMIATILDHEIGKDRMALELSQVLSGQQQTNASSM